jgi:carbamoyltransferase
MKVLGIFMEGPNTGACLFDNARLIAMAEEERYIRVKSASEKFPSNAIQSCLKTAGLRLRDIDVIATGWDHDKYPAGLDIHMGSIDGRERDPHADRIESIIHNKLAPEEATFSIELACKRIDPQARPKISWYSHHQCHVASVHYLSGFESSATLVMDGSGEEVATSSWACVGDELSLVQDWKLPHSLGWFYAAMTEWLGFKAYSGEGKVMGLAPYGSENLEVREMLGRFLKNDEQFTYSLDPSYVYYGPRSWSRKFTDKLVDLLGEPRQPEGELSNYHLDVAYETQRRLEDISIALAKNLLAETRESRLCVSGGVAMNCKMNGLLSNIPGVEEIFINPASHDSGCALGAALLAIRDAGENPRLNVLKHAYWGPSYSDDEIGEVLDHCGVQRKYCPDIADEVARRLAEGQIIGWFQGRAEFGARALGGRSILANPQLADMKDVINAKVKYREAFRPFAPSMLEEVKEEYMVNPKDSPFMILAYPFKKEFADQFPSVVHVDGSVRPQTVNKQSNPLYWNMIKSFGDRTGHPIVLNTSFNVRGEPIVSTPLDAVRCFFSTGMDALALGSYIVTKV